MPRPALLLVLALLLLPACGWREEPVGARADRFPVQVTDAVGSTVELGSAPRVVISLSPDATATMDALGYDGRVVELNDPADAEAVAAASPDLVVAPLNLSAEDAEELAAQAGAPVFRYGAAAFEDAPRMLARLALAVGRGPEGVALAGELREGLATSLARAQTEGAVRVFIDGGGIFTGLGPETPYGALLAAVGGQSVVPATRLLRFSALERADPQAWALTPQAVTTPEQLRDPDSPLADITAVAEGRVFRVDLADFGVTPGLPEALDALVEALHAPAQPLPPSTETGTTQGTTGEPAETGGAITGAG